MSAHTAPLLMVTGATAGIGRATAQLFGRQGWRLVVTGRRQDRLDALVAELTPVCPGIRALCYDTRDRQATLAALATLTVGWQAPDVLVNNAGLALGMGGFDQASMDDWDQMIDTNLKGLLYTAQPVAQQMAARGSGHIINIGSIAGKESYAGGNVYCATKAAVDALTRAMRLELISKGLKVSVLHPGLVDTEFSTVRFKGDAGLAARPYQGMRPLYAEDVAQVLYTMATLPAHIHLADVLLLPAAQASATVVQRS